MADPANSYPGPPEDSPILQGERVTFAGSLSSMTHQQARDLVSQHGGLPQAKLSRKTTMLVVGEEGSLLQEDGEFSGQVNQAAQWKDEGQPIRILRETEWLYLLGLQECSSGDTHSGSRGEFTAAMLSQILDLPLRVIQRWERVGLVKPVRKVFRLSYFDFQEVSTARRLAELLAAGVRPKDLEESLTHLSRRMPHADRPLAQLNILAQNSTLLLRDRHGLVEPTTRQRHFDFDTTSDSQNSEGSELDPAPALPFLRTQPGSRRVTLELGCQYLDEGDLDDAREVFRIFLMEHPGDPEANFYLAETLYRLGENPAALERYHAAVEADHNYLEAWTQLGCLLMELERYEEALEALYIALSVHPDYPDAHWHAAHVLEQLDQQEEAVQHWREYLKYDTRGPWAETARQHLATLGAE